MAIGGGDDVQRDLGRAEGRLNGFERSLDEIKETLLRNGDRLARIEEKLSETKGAWRMLAGVGAIAGAVGATIAKALPALAVFR